MAGCCWARAPWEICCTLCTSKPMWGPPWCQVSGAGVLWGMLPAAHVGAGAPPLLMLVSHLLR
jgi:hypothetical protein